MELFERERELHALREALKSVRLGQGRIALISGEAGIGKTTLARYFITHNASRVPTYWGTCDALFTPRPLGPFVEIAAQMRSSTLQMLRAGSTWHEAASRLLQELHEAGAPVILIIEDIHRADEGTLDMLKFLGRRVEQTGVLLILTFRSDEPTSARLLARLTGELPVPIALRLALLPLSSDSVEEMARRARRAPKGFLRRREAIHSLSEKRWKTDPTKCRPRLETSCSRALRG